MKFSLRTKILILIAGTTSGLAAVVLATLGVLTARGIDHAVRIDVRETGGVLKQLINERTNTLTEECRLLANLPVLKAVAQTGDPSTINDTARDSLGQIDADAVMITDRSGSLLAETDGRARLRTDVAQLPGVSEAIAGNEWTGIVTRRGLLVLDVCVPIKMGPTVWGTFSAYRHIDGQVARELRDDIGADVAFVVNGQVVGSSIGIPNAFTLQSGAPAVVDIGGEKYVALYAPLPQASSGKDHFGFVTLRPYRVAVGPYQNLRTAFIAIFALALLLSMIAGAAVAASVVKPLDGVVAAAHTLSAGGWPDRFDVRRTDEIGLLQSVFNEMTSAIRESREKLLALIDTDTLTGLTNHRRFQERVAEECRRSKLSGEPLTLLRINVDKFQGYNQRHGHAAGDRTLQRIAEILQSCLPDVAVAARFGGDEFAVLLPAQTIDRARDFAESIRQHVDELQDEGASELSVSIGIAEFGTHSKQADGLILATELAVSRARSLGGNRVCAFDSIPGADETADPYQLHKFLKDESLATIQALAAAVDAKDSYTRGHSQSVALYASDLAGYLGLSQADVQLIHTAGTLHDVGKIGVPDAILKKPGRLTDEERAVMETHPVLGELIVRKVPSLAGILPGVRHHHERWDGRGYPDSLAGSDIPQIARILALADCYDAMTSDRPYRKGMGADVALAEIERGAGTQFDPELARAFLSMMRERELSQVA
jgi:diguanylate cyclase (GGDEF)-like protein